MRYVLLALLSVALISSPMPALSGSEPGDWNGTWNLYVAMPQASGNNDWTLIDSIWLQENRKVDPNNGIDYAVSGTSVGAARIESDISEGANYGRDSKFIGHWDSQMPGYDYWKGIVSSSNRLPLAEMSKGNFYAEKKFPNDNSLLNEIKKKYPRVIFSSENFFSGKVEILNGDVRDIWGVRINEEFFPNENTLAGAQTGPSGSVSGSQSRIELTTPQGTKTIQPNEKVNLELLPGQKAEIAARCSEVLNTLAMMAALENRSEGYARVFNIVQGICSALLGNPNTWGKTAELPDVSASNATSPINLQFGLQQGSVRAQAINDLVALTFETPTVLVSSAGKTTFDIAYDPATGKSIISTYQNPVKVQPTNSNKVPFTLGANQRVEVDQNNVGPITSSSQTPAGAGNAGSAYVSPNGKDIYGQTAGSSNTGSTTVTYTQGLEAKNYSMGRLLVGPISIPAIRNTPTDILYLDPGQPYFVVGEGTCSLWSDHTDGVDSCFCYAQWRCPDKPQVWGLLELTNPAIHLSDLIEKDANGDPIYNPSHVYEAVVVGEGKTLQARIYDGGGYDDNNGELRVSIYEAIPIQALGATSGSPGSQYPQGGCHTDPATGQTICVDSIGSFSNPQENAQGGCHTDPATGQTICVDSIGSFSNPQENVQGGCHTDPATGQTICVDSMGSFSNPQENAQGGCHTDPATGQTICVENAADFSNIK
jgi:hypothetical protein